MFNEISSTAWILVVISGLFGVLLKFIYDVAANTIKSRIALIFVPGDIYGTWYCSEYNTKYSIKERDKKIVHTIVKIKKNITGSININVTKERFLSTEADIKTKWKIRGKLIRDTLVGEWYSMEKYSKRYGVTMIQFLDNGLAAGHWIGLGGLDNPVYGFIIMSRNEDSAGVIADTIMDKYNYTSFDTAKIATAMNRKNDIQMKDILV